MHELFFDTELVTLLTNRCDRLKSSVDDTRKDTLFQSENSVVKKFVDEFTVNVPILSDRSNWKQSVKDSKRSCNHQITVTIPFRGEDELFEIRPSTFSANPPQGILRYKELILDFESDTLNQKELSHELEKSIKKIEDALNVLRRECKSWNDNLNTVVRSLVRERKRRYQDQDNLGDIF